jgi:chromosome segregation ATPase
MAALEDAAAAKSEAASLAASVAELQAEGEVQRRRMDAMQAETNLTIERLEAASGAYAREVQRLEGAQSFAIQAIESARGDARQLREQLTGVKDELTAVRARLELSFSEGRTSREAAIGERARADTLASELAKCQAKLEEAQHDLAKAGSAEGIASISQQVNVEAGALPVLSELVEVLEGVLLVHSVEGEAAVALFGFEAGRRLTPWLSSTKELEAFVMPWRETLLALEHAPGGDLPYRI